MFSEADRDRVNAAVRTAEAGTSAELVPVIASRSGRHDRAEDLAGLWLGGAAVAVTWWLYQLPVPEPGNWEMPGAGWQLVAILVALAVGFIVGGAIATRVYWLRRLFTPRAQMQADVASRARALFYDQRVHHTSGGTGLLLYVSLLEHEAVVIADQQVLDRLGQSGIEALCKHLTAGLQAGSPIDALCETLREAGEQLSGLLPRAEADVNELPDALIVLDE